MLSQAPLCPDLGCGGDKQFRHGIRRNDGADVPAVQHGAGGLGGKGGLQLMERGSKGTGCP